MVSPATRLYAMVAQLQIGSRPKEVRVNQFIIAQHLKLRELIAKVVSREEGQDMVEYALLAALISIVAIAIILLLGPYLQNLFQDVVNSLAST
jgi:pilus assembly protein Flp/PilA